MYFSNFSCFARKTKPTTIILTIREGLQEKMDKLYEGQTKEVEPKAVIGKKQMTLRALLKKIEGS